MQNKIKSLSFVIVIIFIAITFFLISKNPSRPPLVRGGENLYDKGDLGGYQNIKYVKIAGQNIKVDLALTGEQRMQGLSGRPKLEENTGMLFIFPKSGKYNFWMKDMNFPIDIIWLSVDKKVIYIKKDAKPESYPETYGPDREAKYILEVVSGFSDKNGLKVGDRAEFTY